MSRLFCHLSFVDIYKSLENFCSSRTKYILTTNFINREGGFDNVDIRSGDYRPIDLFSDPFNFPDTPGIDLMTIGEALSRR